PTHLAVAFDPPAKTFRHTAYPLYKANRSAAPELVKAALEPLQEILKAFNIPVIMMPGFEADDVIGSMATQWKGNNTQIFMVTPDKDYGQLISENVFQYKPAKGGNEIEIIGREQVCQHYGICNPEQVIDILTIWGDSSDNVPGIKGIGEVGAKKLMAKYGSLDSIIEHRSELPQKQQENINASLDQIEMSRFLVTIKTDIELPLKVEDIIIKGASYQELDRVFNRYEFNSLRKMLPADFVHSTQESVLEVENTVSKSYNPKENTIAQIANDAAKSAQCSIIDVDSNHIAIGTTQGYHILEWKNIADIADLLQNNSVSKIGYNIKALYKKLWENGINLTGEIFDIELMHYIINPERTHKEEYLYKSYLGLDMENVITSTAATEPAVEQLDLFSFVQQESDATQDLSQEEKNLLGIRCNALIDLKDKLLEELKSSGQEKLYTEIEAPLVEVLANMEYTGVKIDTSNLNSYSKELGTVLDSIEKQAYELSGEAINLSSPKQVGALLYEKLKLNPKVKKSAKGSYPTDEETLTGLLDAHPIVGKILEYRGIKKLISTYTDALPQLINNKTGKIHTTYNQSLTATGRLSSTNPNLQNIPIRTQKGREIRKSFIPSTANGYIVSADYSQIELRLMAHLSQDPHLVDAFNRNMDIHTATAAKVFKVDEMDVTKEQRSRAKVANFGIIYGISAFGLSQRLGMSRTDSKQLIDEYFNNYPKVKEYMNNMIQKAREEGYVETIYGRKRFLPDINSRNAAVRSYNERNAINAPLQGSAADIIKVAMINIYKRLNAEGLKSKMVLQVHDELIFDVTEQEVEQICNIVTQEMEKVAKLRIPLVA
ncbi:MAG: DNA polymerase I, partial [Bacteroidales bacterium]|nr:DNA polymerase I [Bacteroidales bacterium]